MNVSEKNIQITVNETWEEEKSISSWLFRNFQLRTRFRKQKVSSEWKKDSRKLYRFRFKISDSILAWPLVCRIIKLHANETHLERKNRITWSSQSRWLDRVKYWQKGQQWGSHFLVDYLLYVHAIIASNS